MSPGCAVRTASTAPARNRSFVSKVVARSTPAATVSNFVLALPALARQIGWATSRSGAVSRCSTSRCRRALCGHVTRDLLKGEIASHVHTLSCSPPAGTQRVLLSTNAMACTQRDMEAHRKGAYFAHPCYTQIPHMHPAADTSRRSHAMSESLRTTSGVGAARLARRGARTDPRSERDYFSSASTRLRTSLLATSRREPANGRSTRAVESGR